METSQYQLLYQTEDRHGWFVGNRAVAQSVLDRHIASNGKLRILDVGCGTGKNLEWLARYGEAEGIDTSEEALNFCAHRGLTKTQKKTVDDLRNEAPNQYDGITCFDVLYHKGVTNWQGAINEFFRVVRPGGFVLIRVPAFPILFGDMDLLVHGARRFRRPEMNQALRDAGWNVLLSTYTSFFLFIPALSIRIFQRIFDHKEIEKKTSDLEITETFFSALIAFLLKIEAIMIKYCSFPFGVSLLALAVKPQREDNVIDKLFH